MTSLTSPASSSRHRSRHYVNRRHHHRHARQVTYNHLRDATRNEPSTCWQYTTVPIWPMRHRWMTFAACNEIFAASWGCFMMTFKWATAGGDNCCTHNSVQP